MMTTLERIASLEAKFTMLTERVDMYAGFSLSMFFTILAGVGAIAYLFIKK
jgi:hypothetical protein